MNYTYTDKAINHWGYEDERTIAVARAEEKGDFEDVLRIYTEFLRLYTEFLEEDDYEEPSDIDGDCGFDPYEGCYTYDC